MERALLKAAAHCQGRHSEAGMEIAALFGIPFPLRMKNLVAVAARRGHDPRQLWPWYYGDKASDKPAPTIPAESER